MKKIRFSDGSGGKLISRYAVHPYRSKYRRMGCVIYDGDERIELPLLDHCETCNRKFSDIRSNTIILCTELSINKQLEHVARICVDCQWYYEKRNGVTPPKTIDDFLNTGFAPHLL